MVLLASMNWTTDADQALDAAENCTVRHVDARIQRLRRHVFILC
jgi:hypothetical protein